jgi:hypothetical protein
MCRELGFKTVSLPDAPESVAVELVLRDSASAKAVNSRECVSEDPTSRRQGPIPAHDYVHRLHLIDVLFRSSATTNSSGL